MQMADPHARTNHRGHAACTPATVDKAAHRVAVSPMSSSLMVVLTNLTTDGQSCFRMEPDLSTTNAMSIYKQAAPCQAL